jgi:hypothetical protein
MPSLALIGTNASGKTVLLTVLGHWFSEWRDNMFLEPMTRDTMEFVNERWRLLNQQEWPPATPAAKLHHLHWRLQCGRWTSCDIRVADFAGHDLRIIFGKEDINRWQQLPGQLKKVVDNCLQADIWLVLVNLKDFVGEGDPQKCDENQWALKFALDCWRKSHPRKHFCLVFTQVDQYQDVLDLAGRRKWLPCERRWRKVADKWLPCERRWRKVAETYLKIVYGAHLKRGRGKVFGISAVSDTAIQHHPPHDPRRVPCQGFRSQGLDQLMTWIKARVISLERAKLPWPKRMLPWY